MTQAEFNQMLETAIAQGIGGGTYISQYSGEEIDTLLGLTSYAAGSSVVTDLTTDVNAAKAAAQQAASDAEDSAGDAEAAQAAAERAAQSIEGDVDAAEAAAAEAQAWAEHAGSISVPDGSITPAKLAPGSKSLIAKGGRLKVTVPISASSTTANIGTLSNAAITANMVVLESNVANPSYQTSDWTVTTAAGSLTINGTASAATSVTLILGEV